ncbi:MAG: bifunctional diaminohydroxyphosphoribosylaminopyrimidine deaminase/5-amino-6-(5-phosphoribosylamino)uracil reductase RibD [Bacteroidia bacterium]|nr:bifunctional diaminohydroxyphosphoribosylaminopyrimidine deaminase/5-amino-6-(5-phosphoribosylamino)uracil reductase RibD [Bacteroidia bacterium]
MKQTDDIKFMRRCLELASKAEGLTYPNPMVGSVIVYDGKIIGEGYHLKAGGPHAEVNAINSVSDKKKLKLSTLYVNLEPCSCFGKTPPCADFIISNSIPRVVIGTVDTSEKIPGEGLARLRKAGCEVKTGVVEEECRRINRRFFTFHEKKRPYVTLKWAQSADGYLDILRYEGHKIEPNWITGKAERVLVHKWRASEQSVLVGAGTVRADDPKLNVREWKGIHPLRIILSSSGDISKESSVNETNDTVVVFTHNMDANIANAVKVKLHDDLPSSLQIAKYLFSAGIQSLLIEGGANVLNHFISTGLWDEARIFTGENYFKDGINAPLIQGALFSRTIFSGSSLEILLKNGGSDILKIAN